MANPVFLTFWIQAESFRLSLICINYKTEGFGPLDSSAALILIGYLCHRLKVSFCDHRMLLPLNSSREWS